jgi:DNA-binding transcriptional LysR family regulator
VLDLNEILLFSKIVETHGISAAAAQLGLPKSTVSRKLSQLEERLGVRLVQRTTRKLSLTDVGQAYYDRLRGAMADIIAAEQTVSDMQSSPRGLLRVTAAVDFSERVMGDVISSFGRAYPDVSVELIANDQVVDLVDDGFDVGIRFGPLTESSLTARRLGTFRWCLCAAPSYLKANGVPQSIADLQDHRRVLFAPTSKVQRWRLVNGRDKHDFQRPAQIVSNSFAVVRDALVNGAGIGVCSEFLIPAELDSGTLVRVLPRWSYSGNEVFVVYPSRRHIAPKLKVFVEHVIAHTGKANWQK